MKYECLRTFISLALSRVGYHIGCHPQFYIVFPFIFSLVLSTGLLNLSAVRDIHYIYIPHNARSMADQRLVERLFPINMSEYDYGRVTTFHSFGIIIIVSRNRTSFLDEFLLEDLVKVDKIIQNITFFWNNHFVYYKDLCSKTINGNCFENFPLSLKGKSNDLKKGKYLIKYPVDSYQMNLIITAFSFGGVTLDEKDSMKDFKAIRLFYPLDDSTEEKKKMALKWEDQFLEVLLNINFKNIDVFVLNRQSIDIEIGRFAEISLYLLFIITPVMLLFAAASCLSSDVITSKPWLGIAGCVSPFLGTIAAFGLLIYCKMEYIDLNIVVLFLMLGIGVDDSFILIASWRKTKAIDSVPKRMSEAYSKAAVSISITSLTNFFAFSSAILIPYRCVRIFSIYASLSIVFDYIFQILFFGGFMALDGYREKHKMHSILCHPITKDDSVDTSANLNKERKRIENMMKVSSKVFHEIFGKSITKIIVIFIYIIYLSGAIYCMRFVEEREDFIKLYPFNSFPVKYYYASYKYFTTYPHQIQIVINKNLDYSDINVQNDVENIIKNFESAPFIADSSITESWLREYIAFSKKPVARFSLSGYNLSNLQDFLDGFRNVFLKINWAKRFKNDVLFTTEGDNTVASRFLIASHNVKTLSDEIVLLENIRRIADNSKYPVTVYNFMFKIYELYINTLYTCIKTVCITAALVLIVFFLIYPNISLILIIALTIISIQVGLLGYMSLWNVNLNMTSMILLVMCTGFCVDYPVHVSYAYISCKAKSPNKKIKKCLSATGYPVIQGCISTILGVSVMYFGPAEAFIIFFKIMLLMVIFAAFHSLLVLPVALSLLDSIPFPSRKCKKDKSDANGIYLGENDALNR